MNNSGMVKLGLRNSSGDNAAFYVALDIAKAADPVHGVYVDWHTAEELTNKNAKTFLSDDGNPGVAVMPVGNIRGVFNLDNE